MKKEAIGLARLNRSLSKELCHRRNRGLGMRSVAAAPLRKNVVDCLA